jgi:membrane protein DedA with SNARE-associated domain
MTRNLLTGAVVSFVVFLLTWAVSSFVLNPENIGGRLGLYLLGILAFLAGVVLLIVFLVRRAREKRSAGA